jgi:imidazoleglycerol phosphate synthase glutamine amidotransferase subunit HisH
MRSIKIFFILSTLIISSCSSTGLTKMISEKLISKDKQYVLGSSDIPLIDGLELMEEDSTSFDTMSGDIVISKYKGNFKLKLIKDFYLETLPQLGWRVVDVKKDKISFKREKDKLEIKFDYASKGLYVRFFISSVLQ